VTRFWRRLRRRAADESGNAILEFHTVGLLLLLPLVYVLLTVLDVQRAAFGTTQAAREAARVYAQHGDTATARYAAQVALDDQGLSGDPTTVDISCLSRTCPAPAARVRVVVAADVPLPFLPKVLVGAVHAEIPVVAEHEVTLDAYRSTW
jgi:hypothetical protein